MVINRECLSLFSHSIKGIYCIQNDFSERIVENVEKSKKMKFNRLKMFVINLALAMILLVGCTGVKVGQVKGKIVDNAGKPVQTTVFLALHQGDTVKIDSNLSTSTDNSGNFRFVDVPPGEYVFVTMEIGFDMQPTAAADDKGNTVVVVITPEHGVDLGTITLATK